MWKWLKQLKASTLASNIGLTDPRLYHYFSGGETYAGELVSIETAMRLETVWACVRLISTTISTLPLQVFQKLPDGRGQAVTDTPLYSLLHDQPNADMTAVTFWTSMVACLLLWGNGYALIDRRVDGSVVSLTPLLPNRLTVTRQPNGSLLYHYAWQNVREDYTEDEIFHIKGFSLDGIIGISPISQARETLGIAMAAEKSAASFFRNAMRPSLVMKAPAYLSDPQRERFNEAWVSKITGSINVGRVPIIEGGWTLDQITMKPEDAQLLATRGYSVEQICRWFGVSPVMVGHMDKCLPAGELVTTDHGPVPVEQIKVGDRVYGWTGNGFKLCRVHNAGQNGIKPVLTINTRARSIRCTANHKVLVRRKFAAPQPGMGGYRCVEWRNVWIEAGDITTDDYLIGANGLDRDEALSETNTGRKVTVGLMEFLGIYIAEGSTGAGKGGSSGYVSIARHKDASYMAPYCEAITNEFSKGSFGFGPADGRGTEAVILRHYEKDVKFSSTRVRNELLALGFGGRAHTKRVPGWVFQTSREMKLAFLRGYLDGDGTVSRQGWIAWSSVSPGLIDDIRHLCMDAGVAVGKKCKYETAGSDYEIDGRGVTKRDIYQAWCFNPALNRTIGTHTPLYQERLAAACAAKSRISNSDPGFKGRGPVGSRPGEGFDEIGAMLLKVKSIETSSLAVPVYDIGVEETRSFLSNGVIVSNSTAWGTGLDQMNLWFLTYGLRPWLRTIEQEVTRSVLTPSQRILYYALFNVEGLLRTDSEKRATTLKSLVDGSILTADEARAQWDNALGPKPGGDQLTAAAGRMPLDMLGQPQQPATPPPDPGRQQAQTTPPAHPGA